MYKHTCTPYLSINNHFLAGPSEGAAQWSTKLYSPGLQAKPKSQVAAHRLHGVCVITYVHTRIYIYICIRTHRRSVFLHENARRIKYIPRPSFGTFISARVRLWEKPPNPKAARVSKKVHAHRSSFQKGARANMHFWSCWSIEGRLATQRLQESASRDSDNA